MMPGISPRTALTRDTRISKAAFPQSRHSESEAGISQARRADQAPRTANGRADLATFSEDTERDERAAAGYSAARGLCLSATDGKNRSTWGRFVSSRILPR